MSNDFDSLGSDFSPAFRAKYVDFRRRLREAENRDVIEPNGDVVSVFDLLCALNKKYGQYNKLFLGNLAVDINKINRRNGFTYFTPDGVKNNCKWIENIGFYVEEDGTYFIKLYYGDSRGRIVGTEKVDNFVKVGASAEEANRNKKYFMRWLAALAEFAEHNPGKAFRWDLLNRQLPAQQVHDGMLFCNIDIYNTAYVEPYFVSTEDDALKLIDHSYGEKKISQCAGTFLRRMAVNLNDVDPLISEIVRKEYGLNGPELKKN